METNKKTSYKYCIVPKCKNTTTKTPNKLFFNVPREAKARQQWCKAMKRDKYKYEKLTVNSRVYCCEDHFNIHEDMENYCQYRIMGHVNIAKLKLGVTPHLFECQRLEPSTSIIRTGARKRRRTELVQEALLEATKDVEIPAQDTSKHKSSVTRPSISKRQQKTDNKNRSELADVPLNNQEIKTENSDDGRDFPDCEGIDNNAKEDNITLTRDAGTNTDEDCRDEDSRDEVSRDEVIGELWKKVQRLEREAEFVNKLLTLKQREMLRDYKGRPR